MFPAQPVPVPREGDPVDPGPGEEQEKILVLEHPIPTPAFEYIYTNERKIRHGDGLFCLFPSIDYIHLIFGAVF